MTKRRPTPRPECDVCGDAEAGTTPQTGVMHKHTVGIDRTCRGSGKPPKGQPGRGDRAELTDAVADLAGAVVSLAIDL